MKTEIGRLSTVREGKVGLELVKKNVAGVDIEYYDIDGEVYMTRTQLGDALGYNNANDGVRLLQRKIPRMRKPPYTSVYKIPGSDGKHYKTLLLNSEAIHTLVEVSSMRNSGRTAVLKLLGINSVVVLERIEYTTLDVIDDALKAFRPTRQYKIGPYRVDMCFTDYGIVIECDEHGHSHYDVELETERSNYLVDMGYKVIRFNPHEKGFRLGKVIAEIIKVINTKEEMK